MHVQLGCVTQLRPWQSFRSAVGSKIILLSIAATFCKESSGVILGCVEAAHLQEAQAALQRAAGQE